MSDVGSPTADEDRQSSFPLRGNDGKQQQGEALDEAWFAARARPGIRQLRAYDPGHDLVALRHRFGDALVELGSNENPWGPSPAAREAVLGQLDMLHRYPDPLGTGLRRALAARHGVDASQVLLGNGSHELLMQLAQVFAGPGDEVVCPRYGFAVFALAAQAAEATLRVADALPLDAAMPLGHDLDAVLDAIGPATRLVYLANPNNPTGTWFDGQALAGFLARVPEHVIVVLDEAYGCGRACRSSSTRPSWSPALSARPMAWPACAAATCWRRPAWSR